MSHYHLEIVMPPVADVDLAVKQILEPFDENTGDNEHAFFDYYITGGRWSGTKLLAKLDKDRIREFNQKLVEMKITVSSLRFGKPTLKPLEQIPVVNQLWEEFFPESELDTCPLFDHYVGNSGDIMRVSEVPQDLNMCRLIVARPDYEDKTKLVADYMLANSLWNGVTWQDTAWDGAFSEGIKKSIDHGRCKVPNPDWIAVTVDYHS